MPSPCVVILIGPGASGKSTWALANFPPEVVVSSDRLRAVVGAGEDDLDASDDAFELLDEIVRRRLARRLSTVIDTLGLNNDLRAKWLRMARDAQMPCVAVTFDVPEQQCRAQNRQRSQPLSAKALTAQLRAWRSVKDLVGGEGFDMVMNAAPARIVPDRFLQSAEHAERQERQPVALRFGLHIGQFNFDGGRTATRAALRRVATAAEEAGFDAIYVMDHFRQIPQLGRPWEDFLESYSTLNYLAAVSERARLGTLVTGITYRNVAHLGKIIATLDVLSGGRAICGLGLAWHRDEHAAYGWDFPETSERYAILEDALQLLPALWGPGSPSFKGSRVEVDEALCYPRPIQDHIPLVVGGGGETRTLRLAARYADMANVMGDVQTVRRKRQVLDEHCRAAGRDPSSVELTHLTTALVGRDDDHVAELVDRNRRRGVPRQNAVAGLNAGTVADHIGRFRALVDAGTKESVVRLPDPLDSSAMEQMAAVIAAFR
ncbi:MAG TPA: TIGR03560 family F420-dependent LLM class oxidoreductase [Acidimicrobiales bacterium]|nr:TIGR03560 family F420-dependent LLM class oxidoreductase [Acidimicrobiales bacterium]